jgi:hypothetical protein
MSRVKKVLTIILVVLFVVTLTASAAGAMCLNFDFSPTLAHHAETAAYNAQFILKNINP